MVKRAIFFVLALCVIMLETVYDQRMTNRKLYALLSFRLAPRSITMYDLELLIILEFRVISHTWKLEGING